MPKATVIPKYELEALARCFLPDIKAYFESDKGRQEFEKWQNENRARCEKAAV